VLSPLKCSFFSPGSNTLKTNMLCRMCLCTKYCTVLCQPQCRGCRLCVAQEAAAPVGAWASLAQQAQAWQGPFPNEPQPVTRPRAIKSVHELPSRIPGAACVTADQMPGLWFPARVCSGKKKEKEIRLQRRGRVCRRVETK
jgi:hypothetical protein